MVDQTEVVLWENIPRGGLGFGFYTADVSDADTITFDSYDLLLFATVVKMQDNSVVTQGTLATNKVTINDATISSDRVLIVVIGV